MRTDPDRSRRVPSRDRPPSIEIDGDTARLRTHYFATHATAVGAIIRQAGGWYDCTVRREPAGWRFTHVRARGGWRSGTPLGE
nr:nuclear transport factor 2 family protein [Nocardia sp. alder85J]